MDATRAQPGLLVNLAINYGGRAEIVDAMNSILDMARLRRQHRHAPGRRRPDRRPAFTPRIVPDPDLLIRTSGEMRISNFLLWQIAYAELYVTETLWPDFTQTDLLAGGAGIPEARPPVRRREVRSRARAGRAFLRPSLRPRR